MKFNMNNHIRVQLTDAGRAEHKRQHLALFAGVTERYPYRPPEEDGDGWSEWQAWDFMQQFGFRFGNGLPLMCSTEIEIVEP